MATTASTESNVTLTSQAVSGTAWSGLSTIGRQVLTIASVATVARLLGPRAYGVIGMANLLIVFILYFRDLGTGSAIVQRRHVSDSLLSSLFWVNCCFGFVLSSMVAIASPLAAEFFKTPELIPILCVLAFSFWLSCCSVTQMSMLIREMRFRALATTDLSAALASYMVALTFAYRGFGVWALVFANLANSTVTLTGYGLASGWKPKWEFNLPEVRSIAKYSLNLSGFGLMNYFSRNADNITVGRVLGQAPLGVYQMAYNLMLTPIQNISAVISQATFPAFARIQDDNERFRQAYVRSCMLIALITFPVLAGLGVVADPMIRAILGERWVGAIGIFHILAPVGLFQSVYTTTGQIYQVKGRTDWMFRFGVASSALLVASFLLGVHWGIKGVAVSYCLVFLLLIMPAGYVVCFKLVDLKVSAFARAFVPQLSITGGMALVCWAWLTLLPMIGIHSPWILLSSTVILGASVYVLAMLMLWPAVMQHLEAALLSASNPIVAQMIKKAQVLRFPGAQLKRAS